MAVNAWHRLVGTKLITLVVAPPQLALYTQAVTRVELAARY